MATFTNSDNAGATCELCPNCDGRGFHWQAGKITTTSGNVHTMPVRGAMCVKCYGSGKLKAPVMAIGKLAAIGLLLTPLVLGGYWFLLNL